MSPEPEFVTEKLCHIKSAAFQKVIDLRFDALEASMKLRFDALDAALRLRTNEIDKRLSGLNELREEVVKDRSLLVTKESYDIKTTYYDGWCRNVDRDLTTIKTRAVTWVAAIGFLLVLVQIALHYFLLQKG